jgi:bifunctional non-homologous end joining protein LigD
LLREVRVPKPPPERRAFVRFVARTLPGSRPAPAPAFIEPCLLTQQPKLPAGERWQYEIKLDGYRTQIHVRAGKARAFTRNGLDYTDDFAPVCDAAAVLPANSLVLDGEVVAPDKDGRPNFHALRLKTARDRLLFYAFDLLYIDGFDLRACALADRRGILAQVIAARPGGRILMSETIDEPGDVVLRHVAKLGLEGVVAKRIDSPYRSGRVASWIKVKVKQTMTLPIIGYVPAKGRSIAALRLGRREGGKLIYAGKVGTGFSARTAESVRDRLEPLHRKTAALASPLKKKDTIWVEPKLRANIELTELTDDGMVRHASFKGLG